MIEDVPIPGIAIRDGLKSVTDLVGRKASAAAVLAPGRLPAKQGAGAHHSGALPE